VLVGAIAPEHLAFANGLKKRIEAAGLLSRIVITGELGVEEVQRWYQRLTIYAFTSRNEGFGLTLIERCRWARRWWRRGPALPNWCRGWRDRRADAAGRC